MRHWFNRGVQFDLASLLLYTTPLVGLLRLAQVTKISVNKPVVHRVDGAMTEFAQQLPAKACRSGVCTIPKAPGKRGDSIHTFTAAPAVAAQLSRAKWRTTVVWFFQ